MNLSGSIVFTPCDNIEELKESGVEGERPDMTEKRVSGQEADVASRIFREG